MAQPLNSDWKTTFTTHFSADPDHHILPTLGELQRNGLDVKAFLEGCIDDSFPQFDTAIMTHQVFQTKSPDIIALNLLYATRHKKYAEQLQFKKLLSREDFFKDKIRIPDKPEASTYPTYKLIALLALGILAWKRKTIVRAVKGLKTSS